jgi:hypothetical protein
MGSLSQVKILHGTITMIPAERLHIRANRGLKGPDWHHIGIAFPDAKVVPYLPRITCGFRSKSWLKSTAVSLSAAHASQALASGAIRRVGRGRQTESIVHFKVPLSGFR